ncbi:MAG: hypothetical protein ACLVKS_02920 [Peptococcus niger]
MVDLRVDFCGLTLKTGSTASGTYGFATEYGAFVLWTGLARSPRLTRSRGGNPARAKRRPGC